MYRYATLTQHPRLDLPSNPVRHEVLSWYDDGLKERQKKAIAHAYLQDWDWECDGQPLREAKDEVYQQLKAEANNWAEKILDVWSRRHGGPFKPDLKQYVPTFMDVDGRELSSESICSSSFYV
jgi:hypothetical protein